MNTEIPFHINLALARAGWQIVTDPDDSGRFMAARDMGGASLLAALDAMDIETSARGIAESFDPVEYFEDELVSRRSRVPKAMEIADRAKTIAEYYNELKDAVTSGAKDSQIDSLLYAMKPHPKIMDITLHEEIVIEPATDAGRELLDMYFNGDTDRKNQIVWRLFIQSNIAFDKEIQLKYVRSDEKERTLKIGYERRMPPEENRKDSHDNA